jgi:hypothetical protein
VSELFRSSFAWGLLDVMSVSSLSFIRFMAGFRHEHFRKDNNNLSRDRAALELDVSLADRAER